MLRRCTLLLVLTLAVAGLAGPSAGAGATFARTLTVTGTDAAMYPDFAAATTRYAVTTAATTDGSLTVTATTSDPAGQVWVDGVPANGPTQVTGLSAGDEVSVIVQDGDGRTPYSVMYLPAGFPRLNVTTHQAGLADGYIALTLNTFEGSPLPAYDAIIDRNGVPVYAVPAAQSDLDLKQQPNGDLTVSRLTTAAGHTGDALVTLDDQLVEKSRQDVVAPLTNTDGHDAVKLADGSTILIGYEYDAGRAKTDATIQKLDSDGQEVFRWTSQSLEGETTASTAVQNGNGATGDYAHINSVVSVENGDIIASFRHLSAVLRIATVAHDGYQPGDIIWKLGGRDSDFTFVDDPFGGPCAQHTASELANGHILVYDNGSNGLCVDQSDPTGPTINRGQTRIAEYALDTVAHTATLVWSYAPANTYALFAGSARRLTNGNTLIGWADDRDALATEIAADKQVLWEVNTLPATSGHKNYMTYRAELITGLTDKTKPAVTVNGPADGTTLVVGDSVQAAARCTDRGGSNLDTCTVSGLVGGRLDTSAPGTRSWTTTAADGAGNVTSVVRQYTVRAPVRLADGLVRRNGVSTWKGNDVRPTAAAQTVTQRVRRGHAATSYWRVQNDGERADAFVLAGTSGTPGFRVRYWSNGKDVTAAIEAGRFRTSVLAPGASQQVRVVVTPRRVRGAASAKTFTLRSTSVAATTAVDRVAVRVTVRR
jgi:hypothetical protein